MIRELFPVPLFTVRVKKDQLHRNLLKYPPNVQGKGVCFIEVSILHKRGYMIFCLFRTGGLSVIGSWPYYRGARRRGWTVMLLQINIIMKVCNVRHKSFIFTLVIFT